MATLPQRPKQWYGCNRDARDARDLEFKPRAIRRLPSKIDIRENCPPHMDQGNLGSCVLNATPGVMRYLMIASGQPDVELSRLAAYYHTREIEGTILEDAGCEIRDAIKVVAKLGMAHEKLWPYQIENFTKKPSDEVDNDSIQFRALTYERCGVNITKIKTALALGLPVLIGVALYSGFESLATEKTGIVKMPDLKKDDYLGGHCMYVVGYGQHRGTFTVRNSWGSDWGDKGDCYFPTAYLGSSKLGSDYWVIKSEGKNE